MRGWRARVATMWRHRPDDRGFTLTELMVSMSILSVVMVVVTGAVLLASGTSARVDASTTAQLQTNMAFQKLDRQVRWAAGFSTPGVVAGNDYVEWLYTVGGTATCFQLRLDTTNRKLAKRSWTQGDVRTATAWQVIAAGVTTAPGVTKPFTIPAADPAYPLARLRIAVTATAGGAKGTDTSTQDVVYTAVNSNSTTVPATVCSEGRPS